MAQLGFLLVVGFLLVNKVYSPQYALWLLPLAVMARPRVRDQLIWQGGEIFYFAAVWWYLAQYLDPGGGGDAGFYWLAIMVRVAGPALPGRDRGARHPAAGVRRRAVRRAAARRTPRRLEPRPARAVR